MKRRFMAILLAGGLALGLSGCGGNSGSTTTLVPVATSTEESDVPEEGENTEEVAQESEAEEESQSEETEIVEPEISEPEVVTESEAPTIDIDTSALLTTHVVEYEDQDGYTIRETCRLSPIFREDDAETMYALWEALGNDVADFPSEESLYGASYLLRDARDTCSCNKLEYIIGTYMIENLTEGFPITPDNPRTYAGQLATKHVSTTDQEHDATAADFFNVRSVVTIMQPSGAVCCGEQDAVIFGKAKMDSDIWGPCTFFIALPNGTTPNRPDGYRYDKIPIILSSHVYFYSDYDAFELTYFED